MTADGRWVITYLLRLLFHCKSKGAHSNKVRGIFKHLLCKNLMIPAANEYIYIYWIRVCFCHVWTGIDGQPQFKTKGSMLVKENSPTSCCLPLAKHLGSFTVSEHVWGKKGLGGIDCHQFCCRTGRIHFTCVLLKLKEAVFMANLCFNKQVSVSIGSLCSVICKYLSYSKCMQSVFSEFSRFSPSIKELLPNCLLTILIFHWTST